MPTYQERIKGHLAHYKNEKLSILENGLWKKNRKAYAHILPELQREKNILSPLTEVFFGSSGFIMGEG